MARKSDPIEKFRERQLSKPRTRKLALERQKIRTLFEAVRACNEYSVTKNLETTLNDDEKTEAVYQEMATLLLELRQLLSKLGLKKSLEEFVFQTEAEEFVIELLTGKSTQRQILGRLQDIEERLLPSGEFLQPFKDALYVMQAWISLKDEEQILRSEWPQSELSNLKNALSNHINRYKRNQAAKKTVYFDRFDKAVARYQEHSDKLPGNFSRDVKWARLRISGKTYYEIAGNKKPKSSAADLVRKGVNNLLTRLNLDKATLGLKS